MRQYIERVTLTYTLLYGISTYYILSYLYVIYHRYQFPFEIEWMEGGMIAHSARLLENQAIYAAPSMDFIPFFYTPGYPQLLTWITQFLQFVSQDNTSYTHLSFTVARLTSIACSFALMGILFRAVYKESNAHYAYVAIGLYCALFRTNGAFYDIARPDSLLLLLLGLAIYTAYFYRGVKSVVLSACFIAMAFLTKQTASVFFIAILLYLLTRNYKEALAFFVIALSLTSLVVYEVNQSTHGEFWKYIFEGHQGHVFHWKNILLKYWRDLLFLAPIIILLPLLWFSYASPWKIFPIVIAIHWSIALLQRFFTLDYKPHMYYRELWYENPRWLIVIPPVLMIACLGYYRLQITSQKSTMKTHGFWLWIFIAGAGASALNHSTQWAYANCFMLITLAVCFSLPLMLRDLLSLSIQNSQTKAILIVALVIQGVALYYTPQKQIPQSSDWQALHTLKNTLKQSISLDPVHKKILFPASPFWAYFHHQQEIHTHQMGITDVQYRGGVKDLLRRLRTHEWSHIITHEHAYIPHLSRYYYPAVPLMYAHHHSLRAKTGFMTRPVMIWEPRTANQNARYISNTNVNFEFDPQVKTHTFQDLGWQVFGSAFNQPLKTKQNAQEGRFVAASIHQGMKSKGSIKTKFTFSGASHLTALVKAQAHKKTQMKRADLWVKIYEDSTDRLLAQHRVKYKSFERVSLALPKSCLTQCQLRVVVIDQDHHAAIYIDDIKPAMVLDRI